VIIVCFAAAFFCVAVGWFNSWWTEETSYGPFQCWVLAGQWWIMHSIEQQTGLSH